MEVEVYKGTFPGVMMLKLTEIHSARKGFFADQVVSDGMWLDMHRCVDAIIRHMYRQGSDVTSAPIGEELRVGAKPCDDPDHVAQMCYEDRMHKIMVDPRVLPDGFKEGHYACSVTLSVGRDFWIRDRSAPVLVSTLNQVKCRLVLNLLQRTGDVVPRPLTLWEHWTSEFRRTFMEDSEV